MKDATLGGYLQEHERPPAFEGADGGSYTVEILIDAAAPGDVGPFQAYLFFLKWGGNEPVGHVETEYLAKAKTAEDARRALENMTLHDVKKLLDELVSG